MAVTENALLNGTSGRLRGMVPAGCVGVLQFDISQTSPTAGDHVVLMKLPYPIRPLFAIYQGKTDPGATLTLDVGYATYDGTTVTEVNVDAIIDGFDVNAAGTAPVLVTTAGVDLPAQSYSDDEVYLVAKNATGTTTWRGLLSIFYTP